MISVIIPLYNLERYIERAIHSVLRQTVLPGEIIVVNDGSTDHGPQIVENIQSSLIRLINQPNQGVVVARNRGMKEARGEFLAFLDGDDEWMENHLEVILNLIQKYPQCGLYATSFYFVKNDLKTTSVQPRLNYKYLFRGEEGIIEDYYSLISKSIDTPLNTDTIVIRKSILNKVGGFPLGVKTGEDIYYWGKLFAFCDFAYSKGPTAYYYLGIEGKPFRFRVHNPADKLCNDLVKISSHRQHVNRFIAYWYKNRMVCALLLPSYKLAFSMFFKAIKFDPFEKKIYISLVKYIYLAIKKKKK